jgi:hypothetical protein
MIEISNQQAFGDYPHMQLTPRVELTGGKTYTSTNDFAATLTSASTPAEITFDARGRLLTAAHQPPATGDLRYHLTYRLTGTVVEITATTDAGTTPLQFILPVISRSSEPIDSSNPKAIRITKPAGTLSIRTDAPQGFEPIPKERTFNLVPGFECVPLTITMQPGKPIRIQLES